MGTHRPFPLTTRLDVQADSEAYPSWEHFIVARHLPFHLDDTVCVNHAFLRWRQQGRAEDKRLVDLWTYCYIRRYFLSKFTYRFDCCSADLEEQIDRAYRKVEEHHASIQEAARYANWVSVVCKHTFINYLRRNRRTISLEEAGEPALRVEGQKLRCDEEAVQRGLCAAIRRLPPFLQEVARLFFLDRQPYEDIARATGKPIATVRSYVNKVREQFRDDGQLLSLLDSPRRRTPSRAMALPVH